MLRCFTPPLCSCSSHMIAAILFFAAFIAAANAGAEPRAAVKVGALLTLSGSFAAAGEDCRQGFEAGLREGGETASVQPIYADSKSEPAAAISEFRRMVESEHVAAVYTHRGPIGMTLNPISAKASVPLLGAVGNKDFAAGNSFAVQVWPRSDDEGRFLADQLIQRGLKRAALLYTEDDWTAATSRGFRSRFTELGGELVFDQSVLLGESDFRTLLLQIKARGAAAVYANVLLPQIPVAVRQAREIGLQGDIFCNFYAAKKEVLDAAGAAALEGVRYVEIDTDLPALKAALRLPTNAAIPGLTVASYAAAVLLSQAAAETGLPASPQLFHSALLKQREIRTLDRTYPIEERYVKFPLVVKTLHDGKGVKD